MGGVTVTTLKWAGSSAEGLSLLPYHIFLCKGPVDIVLMTEQFSRLKDCWPSVCNLLSKAKVYLVAWLMLMMFGSNGIAFRFCTFGWKVWAEPAPGLEAVLSLIPSAPCDLTVALRMYIWTASEQVKQAKERHFYFLAFCLSSLTGQTHRLLSENTGKGEFA